MRKYYFINKFETNNIDKQDKQTVIIFRNYSSKVPNEKLILKIKKYCKIKGIKFFLSNNIKLAIKLDLDGAYIPSFNKDMRHLSFSSKNKFLLIGSAHNNKEIKIKENQGVRLIFISSIFKKNQNFLGINRFKLISKFTKKNIVALGGINERNVNKLRLLKCDGYAAIRYLTNKKKLNNVR